MARPNMNEKSINQSLAHRKFKKIHTNVVEQ